MAPISEPSTSVLKRKVSVRCWRLFTDSNNFPGDEEMIIRIEPKDRHCIVEEAIWHIDATDSAVQSLPEGDAFSDLVPNEIILTVITTYRSGHIDIEMEKDEFEETDFQNSKSLTVSDYSYDSWGFSDGHEEHTLSIELPETANLDEWCDTVRKHGEEGNSGETEITFLGALNIEILEDDEPSVLSDEPAVLSPEQLKEIQTLLCSEDEADRQQAGERLQAARVTDRLDLSNCEGLTDAGLSHLSGLTNLTELDLSNCEGLTGTGLSHLSGLKSLTMLDLSNCEGLESVHLSGLPNLTSLNLWGCRSLTDAGLSHLAELANLTTLDLNECEGLESVHLSGLPNLATLNLHECIGLESVHLSELPNLTTLHLFMCGGLTDAGLSHLSGLPSLTTLDLSNCEGLTDAGLSHLTGLTSLTGLYFDDCEKVSDSVREDPLGHLAQLRSATAEGTENVNVTDRS
jgi:hypothetical protein